MRKKSRKRPRDAAYRELRKETLSRRSHTNILLLFYYLHVLYTGGIINSRGKTYILILWKRRHTATVHILFYDAPLAAAATAALLMSLMNNAHNYNDDNG